MKIWFPAITGNSGTDVYTIRLAEALQKRGIETVVTWYPTLYQFAPFLLSRTQAPPETTLIHVNSWSGFAFKRPGIPLIVTEHHCVFDPMYRPYKNFLQNAYHQSLIRLFSFSSFRNASSIVADSHFTASSLRRTAGISNVEVIHLWVDINLYTPRRDKERGKPKPFTLLYTGNLSQRKGGDLLEPIMQKLGPDFELRFTSGLRGETRGNYPRNMIPLGRLDEAGLIRAYQECDALLCPSRFEGFGYSALEAMACGKPVVASDSTSLPEVTLDGVTGLLCKIGDIDGFTEACRRLAGDDTLRAQLGNNARNRAVGHFSEEVAIPRYLSLYERVAGERR